MHSMYNPTEKGLAVIMFSHEEKKEEELPIYKLIHSKRFSNSGVCACTKLQDTKGIYLNKNYKSYKKMPFTNTWMRKRKKIL